MRRRRQSRRARWALVLGCLLLGGGLLWPHIKAEYSTPPTALEVAEAGHPASEGIQRGLRGIPPPPGTPGYNREAAESFDSHFKRTHGLSGSASSGAVPSLVIPAIGVDALVQPLTTNSEDELNPPTNIHDVGLWLGGSLPGEPGPVVIAGHVDSAAAGLGALFWLREVKPGDKIAYTDASGNQFVYEVTAVRQYLKTAFPTNLVYTRTQEPVMRVITCGGAFDYATGHYYDNTIVFASLVSRPSAWFSVNDGFPQ